MTKGVRQVAFSRPAMGPAEAAAAAAAVESGWIVGGPMLAELEAAFAARCETKHAVGVSSWTTGAFLVLKTLGIGPGDEVIVPSLTFIASVNAIVHAGATPVFADIDPATYNIDVDDAASKITSRTRAILPVDQIGLPCEIDRLADLAERHRLLLIQDAACSIGSLFRGRPCGAEAPVSIFSLHARKVVTTGEGGMIVTNDDDLARRLRRQRHQGMSLSDFERHGNAPTVFEQYPEVGYNFRITDIQAAVGIEQMRRLDDLLASRHRISKLYNYRLCNHPSIQIPYVPGHVTPNWQSYQLLVRADSAMGRDEIMNRLYARGVATRRGVMASHREAPYASYQVVLPRTEAAADRTFQLPLFHDLTDQDANIVIDEILNLNI